MCVCECVSTVDVMGHDPYWRPFKVFESTHHKVASLKTVAQDLSQLHRTVDKTIAYDCLSSYMFNTSTWSLLKKRHPHACPKEMWHFAFLYSHSATWWCQNQPQSFSHRKPPLQERLEMFGAPTVSKKSFGTRNWQFAKENNEGTKRSKEISRDIKRQRIYRTDQSTTEHYIIIHNL